MIDTQVRQMIDKPLILMAKGLMALGLRANHVTILGFVIGVSAGFAIIKGAFLTALILILISRLCDGLDGTIARQLGVSDKGAFLDITFDFLFYGWIVLSFAFYDGQNALLAACLLFSFIGTGASFLAYATIAEKTGIDESVKGKKSIYYLGGLTEGTETIVFLCALCLWPSAFTVMAGVFCLLCLFTTTIRIYRGWTDFS